MYRVIKKRSQAKNDVEGEVQRRYQGHQRGIATMFWHRERRVCHAKPSIDELRATDFLVFSLQIRWEATTSKRFGEAVDFS
jgi:hypothetical protein